jgi:large subunit ribosomal protein L23
MSGNIPKSAKAARTATPVRASERLINLLLAPHVSEKAARATEKTNQYVFRVRTDATKPEIRAAVELMFSVAVEAVQVVNVGGKQKRFGSSLGRRSDWKKAYVSLKAGQSIDFSGGVKA